MIQLPTRIWLIAAVIVLLIANIAWRVYANWGLISLKVTDAPIEEVLSEFRQQGRIDLLSNLDPETTVTLDLDRVPVGEALESLGAVTESRWRLVYFMGTTKGELAGAVSAWEDGKSREGWKWFDSRMPMGAGFDADEPIPDPRGNLWIPAPDAVATDLQTWLTEAGLATEAGFVVPEEWNPEMAEVPRRGQVDRVVAKVAKKVGGRSKEVFLLSKSRRAGPPEGNAERREGRPGRGEGRDRPSPELMARAVEARIAKLPENEQAAARDRMKQMRERFRGFGDLSEEERRAKLRELMNDPILQERIDERRAAGDARKTPEQRIERYRRYVERKNSN